MMKKPQTLLFSNFWGVESTRELDWKTFYAAFHEDSN